MESMPISLMIPRHRYSPREAPRAADLWRIAQQAAVEDSTRRGWPPGRYIEVGTGFVIYGVTATHHRTPRYGEPLSARTWVADFRRGILSRREVRVLAGGALVASFSQDWAHVSATLAPCRAPAALLEAFAPRDRSDGDEAQLPAHEPVSGPGYEARFRCWYTGVDPNNHANNTRYLDWCDEATALWVASLGGDPQALVPVAERLRWRSSFTGGELVITRSRLVGVTGDGAAVIEHALVGEDGRGRASSTAVRRLEGGALAELLRG